jgi:transposase
VGVCEHTVSLWRSRFHEKRIEGLNDEPRPGAPRKIGDDAVEEVVRLALESKPQGETHWSTRSMAKKVGLTQTAVSRIWRAFGLQPHRSDGFILSNDPLLVDKVRDIVGLYMCPPTNALVLCVDEKSQIQALQRSQPVIPMQIGQTELQTHDYARHGTTTLFAALNHATGNVIGKCYPRHRSSEFVKFLDVIDVNVPKDLDVHLVLDNYATHKTDEVKRWLLKRPRYHLHFTPTHASWLNLVERWFALLTQKAVKRASHTSVSKLEMDIRNFIEANNTDPKPFKWHKTADEILASIARFATRTLVLSQEQPNYETNQ